MELDQRLKTLLLELHKLNLEKKELTTKIKNVQSEIDGINGYIMRGQ